MDLTFTPGVKSLTVSVPIIDDAFLEDTEQFFGEVILMWTYNHREPQLESLMMMVISLHIGSFMIKQLIVHEYKTCTKLHYQLSLTWHLYNYVHR